MEARLDSVGDGPMVQSMTTSPGPLKKPDFFVRRARVAGRYSVSVAIPNGMEDDIYVFDTAQEAKDWSENDSDQWLILLCHKFHLWLLRMRRTQCGHR